MWDVLFIAAAIFTIVGGLIGTIKAVSRKRTRRQGRHAHESPLLQIVSDFIGRTVSAHGRLMVLGKLRASWLPVSETTAARLGEPLMREGGAIASLRTKIRVIGDAQSNLAADDVLRVLEETAELLNKRKSALRRVDWEERQAAISEAIQTLEETARAST